MACLEREKIIAWLTVAYLIQVLEPLKGEAASFHDLFRVPVQKMLSTTLILSNRLSFISDKIGRIRCVCSGIPIASINSYPLPSYPTSRTGALLQQRLKTQR
jgi:hypothetical protein